MNYQIKVMQESETTYQSGKVKTFDDFPRILRQVEKSLVKGEKAVITLSYTEESEEQKAFERAEIKRIVREEFEKMKEQGEI